MSRVCKFIFEIHFTRVPLAIDTQHSFITCPTRRMPKQIKDILHSISLYFLQITSPQGYHIVARKCSFLIIEISYYVERGMFLVRDF